MAKKSIKSTPAKATARKHRRAVATTALVSSTAEKDLTTATSQASSANSWNYVLKLIGKFAMVVALVVVVLQANHWSWKGHILVDGYFAFYDRAHYFMTHGNLTDIPFNEYQPGAIFYFVALSPIFWLSETREMYIQALIWSNVVLLIGYAWILKNKYHAYSNIVLALIVLSSGPLILYRFEVYCHLLVFWCFYLWQRNSSFWSTFSLGMATLVKVYPVVLLPYFLLHAYKTRSLSDVLKAGSGYVLGCLFVLFSYMMVFQVPLSDVIKNVTEHARKPVHVESVIGTFNAWKVWVVEDRPAILDSRLIHGIHASELVGPVKLYNYLWIPVLGAFYGYLWLYTNRNSKIDPLICTAIVALFLLFATQLGPQYFLWFLLFMPLIAFPQKLPLQKAFITSLFLAVLFFFVTQFQYPLHYTELLNYFKSGTPLFPFYYLLIKNMLFTVYVIHLLWWVHQHLRETRNQATEMLVTD
jgi:hypothetical protein